MPSSRRTFLAALSGAAAALAGCSAPGRTGTGLDCDSIESAWPMAVGDDTLYYVEGTSSNLVALA